MTTGKHAHLKNCAFWARIREFKQIPLIAVSIDDQLQGIMATVTHKSFKPFP